jgi:7-cyano-7-deazaguanine reductase
MPRKIETGLETFANPNPNPKRDFLIRMQIPEFTCLCPKTGQPDFATLYLDYIADRKCVELKSLKLYVWSYRDKGAFHEAVTNQILDDLVAATRPRFMRLTAKFNVRGGIFTSIVAEHRKTGWKAQTPVELPAITPRSSTST